MWSYVKSDGMNILRSFRYVDIKCLVSTNHEKMKVKKLQEWDFCCEIKRIQGTTCQRQECASNCCYVGTESSYRPISKFNIA